MLMSEEGEGLLWCYQMGLLECLKPMHALLKHIFLHVQVHVCDIIMPMEVYKDSKPSSKIFGKLELGLELCAILVKSPNRMLCMKNAYVARLLLLRKCALLLEYIQLIVHRPPFLEKALQRPSPPSPFSSSNNHNEVCSCYEYYKNTITT